MPRKTRIATVCQNYDFGPDRKANIKRIMALTDQAGCQQPDIICLPEAFATVAVDAGLEEKAEAVPGPTVEAFAGKACEYNTNIICPLLTAREGRFYNSAVVIDRTGEIVGIYDKVQPVTNTSDFTEVERGIVPGREAQVFDLDCGRIGIQICFDIGFPNTWEQLAQQGAEAVFWPSAYDGGFPLQAHAYTNDYYVASSVRSVRPRIINPLGEIIAQGGRRQQVITATVDLDYLVCHCDYHWGMDKELIKKYGTDVTITMMDEEGKFLVYSNREDLPMQKLAEEFGLESRRDYHARHAAAYTALREGQKPEAQRTPYLGREAYTPMSLEEWQQLKSRP
ncbi:carbon-nitrogen hydrolase family protein [Planctomycetota bacterium]